MSRFRIQLPIVVLLVMLAGTLLVQAAGISVGAESNIEPAATPNAWLYLPIVKRSGQALTPTATHTATPTNTPEPGRLASPTLFDILNDDNDGDFTVGWSTVPGAEYFRLEEKHNTDAWLQVYEGPQQEIARGSLADGTYCYRVMALNAAADSEWSTVKCTSVVSATSTPTATITPTATNTPLPGEVPAPIIFDIENADGDGNYTVNWSAVASVDDYRLRENINNSGSWKQIYIGPGTSFNRSNMPEGRHCYRVRARVGTTLSDWSEDRCTAVGGTSAPLTCSFEIVGRIDPGIAGHQMTILQEKNIVVITGGFSDEKVGDSWEWKIRDGIYVYNVEKKRLYFAGNLKIPRKDHMAIPLDDFRVLLIGGNDSTYETQLDNEIVHIEELPDGKGYRAYGATQELTFNKFVLGQTIDAEKALVITGNNDDSFSVWFYEIGTGAKEYAGSFRTPRTWDWPRTIKLLNERGTKFLVTTEYGVTIVDIKTNTSESFDYPLAEEYGEFFRRYIPEVTPLNENVILVTNGNYYDGPWARTSKQAFIVEDAENVRRISDTNYSLFSRIVLETSEGYVILLSGYDSEYIVDDYSLGTEVFDPFSETFFAIGKPHSPHANGEGIKLADGNSFLISGGYDDFYEIDEISPTTADLVELVTCR